MTPVLIAAVFLGLGLIHLLQGFRRAAGTPGRRAKLRTGGIFVAVGAFLLVWHTV
jgi:hypothetical protein